MADPTAYTISYSFTDYQTASPSDPLPAANIDVEYANIAISLASLRTSLMDVRRSDGALTNGIVTKDSLALDLKIALVAASDLIITPITVTDLTALTVGATGLDYVFGEKAGVIVKHEPGALMAVEMAAAPEASASASYLVGLNASNAMIKITSPIINACDHGVFGDGGTYTTQLDAAFAAADAVQGTLVLPAGTFTYDGTGWNSGRPQIVGNSQQGTVVVLGAASRLIDSNQAWGTMRLERVKTSGGLGAIRNTYTGTNVSGKFYVRDCYFWAYTSACIEANSTDMPYWHITGNVFYGANFTTCMGVALAGWCDSNYIVGNAFLKNKINLKMGRSGHGAYVNSNDFLRLTTGGTDRIDVWLVPEVAAGYTNSGQGLVIRDCKFGNENLDDTDYRILIADEGAGTCVGDKLPVFTASTGVVTNITIRDCLVYGNGAAGAAASGQPFIYSTTEEVRAIQVGDIKLGGTPVTMLLEFLTPPTADLYNQNSVLGPVYMGEQQFASYKSFKMTNGVGVARIIDPTGVAMNGDPETEMALLNRSTASTGEFINLYTANWSTGGYSGGASGAVAVGPDGESCTEITFASNGTKALTFNNTPVAGTPLWVDFDIAPGAVSPLTRIMIGIYDNTAAAYVYKEWVNVPASGFRKLRKMFTPRSIPAGNFKFVVANNDGDTGSVIIARVRCYQSREPAPGNVHQVPLFICESLAVPATPVDGGYLYIQGGALKFIGTSGTITTLGVA